MLTVSNSILSGVDVDNCGGALLDGGGNLSWPAGDNCGFSAYGDPLLGPLHDNGGATQTVVPAAGSPALGAGDIFACAEADQRGLPRGLSESCDSGAVQRLPAYNVTIVPGSSTVNLSPFGQGFYPNGPDAEVGIELVQAALAGGAVTVHTGYDDGGQAGTLTLDAALDYDGVGTASLSLTAKSGIALTGSGDIGDSAAGGDSLAVTLDAGGPVNIAGAVETSGGDLTVLSHGGEGSSIDASGVDITGDGDAAITMRARDTVAVGGVTTANGDITLDAGGSLAADHVWAGGLALLAGSRVQVTGLIPDTGDSVRAGQGGLHIYHGGAGETPFRVGDASLNGTAGALTTGVATIPLDWLIPGNYAAASSPGISVATVLPVVDFDGLPAETGSQAVAALNTNYEGLGLEFDFYVSGVESSYPAIGDGALTVATHPDGADALVNFGYAAGSASVNFVNPNGPVKTLTARDQTGTAATIETQGATVVDSASGDGSPGLLAVAGACIRSLQVETTGSYFVMDDLAYALMAGPDADGNNIVDQCETEPETNHVFTVTTAAAYDDGVCSLDDCTLPEAINAANDTPNAATPDEIHFAIPGDGPHVIQPSSMLPEITEAVVIDGYTQPGASPNTLAVGNDAVLQIVLTDGGEGTSDGLIITSAGSTVSGLVIDGWSGNGIVLSGSDASGNAIAGNFIGVDAAGTVTAGNGGSGVLIEGGAHDNTVGGATPAAQPDRRQQRRGHPGRLRRRQHAARQQHQRQRRAGHRPGAGRTERQRQRRRRQRPQHPAKLGRALRGNHGRRQHHGLRPLQQRGRRNLRRGHLRQRYL
ncbi:MAG: choice-of-anchor Q domain-containing protein [Caldilineales bacterium]